MHCSVFSIGHSPYLYISFAFIMKIFNLRGNYPVVSNYAVSEKSTSFCFKKENYLDLQCFPTSTSYMNRTVY